MNKEDEMNDKDIRDNTNTNNKTTYENEKEYDGNILDKLFFKTKTKPYIYYLPLTKDQVKQKLEKKKSDF